MIFNRRYRVQVVIEIEAFCRIRASLVLQLEGLRLGWSVSNTYSLTPYKCQNPDRFISNTARKDCGIMYATALQCSIYSGPLHQSNCYPNLCYALIYKEFYAAFNCTFSYKMIPEIENTIKYFMTWQRDCNRFRKSEFVPITYVESQSTLHRWRGNGLKKTANLGGQLSRVFLHKLRQIINY